MAGNSSAVTGNPFWELTTPPTDVEVAELMDATRPAPDISMIARRLAFERDQLREDAARWRAFIGSHRVRVLGTADDKNGYRHIGVELWSKYSGCDFDESGPDRNAVTAFADAQRSDGGK